jgi:hypothetical protein
MTQILSWNENSIVAIRNIDTLDIYLFNTNKNYKLGSLIINNENLTFNLKNIDSEHFQCIIITSAHIFISLWSIYNGNIKEIKLNPTTINSKIIKFLFIQNTYLLITSSNIYYFE